MKNANPVSRGGWALAALLALGAAGCGGSRPPDPAAAAAPRTVFDHFPVRVAGQLASLQVAVTPAEQERGLMQRPDLHPDEGMLFANREPRELDFWMHNTPEALDIAYIDRAGVVAEIYGLLPNDERTVRSHRDDLQYALEMPSGWFAAHGIRAGAALDMGAVGSALRARGYDPAKFGIPPG